MIKIEIYNYHNEEVGATPEEIFEVVNDDSKLKEKFSIIKEIEYDTKDKRAAGTKFRTTLAVRNQTYRFRSEITEYVENESITVKSKLKQGVVTTVFNVSPGQKHTVLRVKSSIDSSNVGVKIFVMTIKPIVKTVMNREMKKFVESIR